MGRGSNGQKVELKITDEALREEAAFVVPFFSVFSVVAAVVVGEV